MTLPITLLLAAACGAINLWLGLRVSARRMQAKIMSGDGGDPVMQARTRAHANFTEYAPFVLVLVAAIELARGPSPWLWGAAALFVLARVAHPFGMDRPAPNPFRAGGIALTWGLLAALALWAAVVGWQAHAAATPADTVETMPASA